MCGRANQELIRRAAAKTRVATSSTTETEPKIMELIATLLEKTDDDFCGPDENGIPYYAKNWGAADANLDRLLQTDQTHAGNVRIVKKLFKAVIRPRMSDAATQNFRIKCVQDDHDSPNHTESVANNRCARKPHAAALLLLVQDEDCVFSPNCGLS
ncbi:hypothetical protein CSHISOI_11131 [Colletotrichum shisoi]|uniref:Uncharacterized protein n=1 Tax=Colletotrichum shisoi TaxID=2078593 RepID=A0A5Q4BC67_9PEZI|nr:hypothetical protein CSHISOI_11131 [Colletotrichum shisoi]